MNKLKSFNFCSFKFTNEEEFDANSRYILNIFYAFGFYHPSPSKARMVYGFMMCTFTIQMYLLGAVKDIISSISNGEMLQAMVNAAAIPYCFTLQVQILTFVFQQPEVIKVLKELQSLMCFNVDERLSEFYKGQYQKIKTFYKLFLTSGTIVLILMKALGFQALKLIIPTLYDVFAEGSFYNFFLILSIIQTIFILVMFFACDFLHILCMTRIEENLATLAEKIRHCTDDTDSEENERKLLDCIKHHCKILR